MPTRMTLESTPSVSFSTEPTKGYYLGYFVEEETDSLNLINEYYFTIKSQENDYQRQIKIKDSFPYLLGD